MFDNIPNIKEDSDRIELQQRKRNELKLIGSEKRNKSHTLFSFNTVTKEIKKAEYYGLCDTIHFATLEPIEKPKVLVEKNCIYRQAMNKANFIKRLKREGFLPT